MENKPVESCSIPGCDGKHYVRNMCSGHYQRWLRHGEVDAGRPLFVRDGRRSHSAHGSWYGMKKRCQNPEHSDYRNYGGRGISVCAAWEDFWVFVLDMGERPVGLSIDRIDNNGNYEPGNCRWASAEEQNRNKRSNKLDPTKVREIRALYGAGDHLQRELAEQFGVSESQIGRVVNRERWATSAEKTSDYREWLK